MDTAGRKPRTGSVSLPARMSKLRAPNVHKASRLTAYTAAKEYLQEAGQGRRSDWSRRNSRGGGGEGTIPPARQLARSTGWRFLRWPAAEAGGRTGRSWAAESRRWAAAQLLVAQMGAKIALVGGGRIMKLGGGCPLAMSG
ncbi:hypothetical protein ACQJBY_057708 [Aegilops geniculata]